MKILVLGGDGYLGWPTALHLSQAGHEVAVADNFVRRPTTTSSGSSPGADRAAADPDRGLGRADRSADRHVRRGPDRRRCSLPRRRGLPARGGRALRRAAGGAVLDDRPGARGLHPAEQRGGHPEPAVRHRRDDPDIHLVKLGTMGEYGTPNIDIEEGWLETRAQRADRPVLFPKRPGSFYHLSKVHDSHNIEFACRIWGLRATDLNQGVVYGQETPQTELTAAGHPVRLRRGVRHRAEPVRHRGGHRPPADRVRPRRPDPRHHQHPRHRPVHRAGLREPGQTGASSGCSTSSPSRCRSRTSPRPSRPAFPGDVTIENLDNPRVEAPEHYYNVKHTALVELGLEPHLLSDTLIESLFEITKRYAHRVRLEALRPTIKWRSPTA